MYHGLSKDLLYSAYRITSVFKDDLGNSKTKSGTAFWLMNKKSQLCLITNRHMLDLNYSENDMKYKYYSIQAVNIQGKAKNKKNGLPEDEVTFLILKPQTKFSKQYSNDVACIVDPQIIVPEGQNKNVIIDYYIPYDDISTSQYIEELLLPCDFVAFPGYPEWHDRRLGRPIFRVGTIASDPRYDYSYKSNKTNVEGNCIAYEAFSFGGSSGSPVFSLQKGLKAGQGISVTGYRPSKFIGINAGHFDTGFGNHSGISYFYKSSCILDIIDEEIS